LLLPLEQLIFENLLHHYYDEIIDIYEK
jgi:hypothetical protein